MAKDTNKTNIDELAKIFGIPSWEEIDELNQQHYWESVGNVYEEAIADGKTEEEADEARMEAEQAEQTEVFHNWHNALMTALEPTFYAHAIVLDPLPVDKKDEYPFEYKIEPTSSWKDAANKIRMTINGVGMFEFDTLKDFLDSGPYTPRQAVLTHWHAIKDWPEVYGETSALRRYDAAWR